MNYDSMFSKKIKCQVRFQHAVYRTCSLALVFKIKVTFRHLGPCFFSFFFFFFSFMPIYKNTSLIMGKPTTAMVNFSFILIENGLNRSKFHAIVSLVFHRV